MLVKKERRDKEIFEVGEICLLQNLKTGSWKTRGKVIDVRVPIDNTIQRYILDIDGLINSRHWKYLHRIPEKLMNDETSRNASSSAEDRGNTYHDLVVADTVNIGTDIHTRGVTRPDTATDVAIHYSCRRCHKF